MCFSAIHPGMKTNLGFEYMLERVQKQPLVVVRNRQELASVGNFQRTLYEIIIIAH